MSYPRVPSPRIELWKHYDGKILRLLNIGMTRKQCAGSEPAAEEQYLILGLCVAMEKPGAIERMIEDGKKAVFENNMGVAPIHVFDIP